MLVLGFIVIIVLFIFGGYEPSDREKFLCTFNFIWSSSVGWLVYIFISIKELNLEPRHIILLYTVCMPISWLISEIIYYLEHLKDKKGELNLFQKKMCSLMSLIGVIVSGAVITISCSNDLLTYYMLMVPVSLLISNVVSMDDCYSGIVNHLGKKIKKCWRNRNDILFCIPITLFLAALIIKIFQVPVVKMVEFSTGVIVGFIYAVIIYIQIT